MTPDLPAPPPPIVKDYVDHQVDQVRREIEPRLDSIDQKLAGDLVRFDALGKRIDDQGRSIHQRIDDVRGDVRGLGTKIDLHHRERMDYLRAQEPPSSWWSRLPVILRVFILTGTIGGTVIGGAALAIYQVVKG